MKSRFIHLFTGALLLLFVMAVDTYAQKFIHPGILHTQADFDRVKQQLADKDPAVTAGYNKLLANYLAVKMDGQWGPTEYIKRGVSGDENFMQATRDASMAYLIALRYKITDDPKLADRVISILDSYPPVTKGISGNTNASLASGFIGYYFANAAELVRGYEGWKPEKFKAFQQWMIDVFFCGAQDFLQRRHGTCNSHYQSNWGACNILTVISIGVLCDDPAIYNTGMWFLKQGDGNESISMDYCGSGGGIIPFFHEDERGPYGYLNQMQESTRDQPHCLGALGMLLCSSEVGWNQGDNIWNSNNNIIGGAVEYVAAWNSYNETTEKEELDNFPSTGWSGCGAEGWQPSVSWSGRGQMRPVFQIAINHFGSRMGKEMTFAKRAKVLLGVEGGPGDYGSNSGGFDNVGYGDLMYNEKPYDVIPTVLRPRIVYSGKNNDYAEISKVTKGDEITLQALLPDGEEDTGLWEWDNGETGSGSRTFKAENSAVYRVTYTNSEGAKSRQMFSVAVYGDCLSSTVIPSYTWNGVTVNDTLVMIPKGATLKMSAAPKAWNYDNTIKWNNGQTGSSIEVSNISSARTYTATITNRNGGVTKVSFRISISELTPYMERDGVKSTESYAEVAEGANIKLWVVPVASAKGGTYEWSDGSAKDTLMLEDIREGGTFTLLYTSPAGTESKATWKIDVITKNKLPEGDYYFLNAETNTFFTNPCADYATDNSETMSFEEFKEDDPDTQIWTFVIDPSSNRYKITSKKDSRFLNEFAVIRNRAYFPEWNSYEIYGLSGTDGYAIQNGGSSGTQYWTLNSGNSITGKGTTDREGFPFLLLPVGDDVAIGQVEAFETQFWQDGRSDEITLRTSVEGKFVIVDMNGTVLTQIHCQEGTNRISINELKPGLYIGILQSPGGNKSFKILKK